MESAWLLGGETGTEKPGRAAWPRHDERISRMNAPRMLTERMSDLTIEQNEDGSITLEQDGGCGEVWRIDLHPELLT
jgi:hypothetical protein